jgi:diguanylate cyclase (GGDEF)-like protein/PAS domain S-box-containing protein
LAAKEQKPKTELSAIRGYVLILVASILVLSGALIAYLYWHENTSHRLEEALNSFHLESMLRCVQIADELHHINHAVSFEREANADALKRARVNALHLIKLHLNSARQIYGDFEHTSRFSGQIEPILHKTETQFNAIRAAFRKPGKPGSDPMPARTATLVKSFSHGIEQLRRLHEIARDEIRTEAHQLNHQRSNRLLIIFGFAALLGSLIVWKMLTRIKRLIDAQTLTESKLRQSAAVFENASEGVLITDTDANIVAVNQAFTEITGYTEAEVVGRNPRILKSGCHDRAFYADMWSSLLQRGGWKGEISGRRKNGEVFPKWQTITGIKNENGELTHYVSVFSDISHIKESEQKLHHLAHHDSLTGLPNRMLLLARLEHSLQHASREGSNVAVMFLDLDHFKKINDSFGHPAGDKLLQMVAGRLLNSVRKDDTVARLGGDELTIILGSLNDANYAATAANKILERLAKPFHLEGQDVFVSASIGISIYPQDGKDTTSLLKNADTAMYMAKNEGRQRYHFYSRELTDKACEALALESQLHRALAHEELFLQYQPQISLSDGRIVGVEALLRWQHPEIGLVSPDKFIPLAEQSGLIGPIGKWVMHTACSQAKAWQDQGLERIRMSVNLSGRQLARADIVDEVREVLAATGLDPAYLELELTESSVMTHAGQAASTLDALRALGTTIAIDDFGTGYSSLAYLKRFAVDRLKIDRSFVRDIPEDMNDVALAKAIIALAQSLNLDVVAEGVETEAQRELLKSLGCHEMQGFLFSAPRAASDLTDLLTNESRSICVNA